MKIAVTIFMVNCGLAIKIAPPTRPLINFANLKWGDSSTDIKYPYDLAPRGDVVDTYPGNNGKDVRVPDPYRWMEDLTSNETQEWVEY
jgi:hypothetical protein